MQSATRTLAPGWSGWSSALRCRQWTHFLVLPLASIDAAGMEARAGAWHALRGVALATFVLSYAYGLNAISDRRTDLDPRKNPLAGEGVVPLPVMALVAAAFALAAGVAVSAPPLVRVAVAMSLAASTLYSVGPRLKTFRAVGTLVNGAIFLPILTFSLSTAMPPSLPTLAAACLAMILQNQLMHERVDLLEDLAGEARTTGAWLGERGVTALVVILGVAGCVGVVALGSSAASAWAGVVGLGASSALVFAKRSWAERRRLHRWVAIAGGALLFVVERAR